MNGNAENLPPDARIVIPHADDVGMCHGANRAFMELAGLGFVTTGSVMVPCPWFAEIADWAKGREAGDLGVHLTLTSEWQHYRWGPISTRSPASGLLDADGCLPRRVPELRAGLDPVAAEDEMRAQIERAMAMGIRPTHLDTHMGAALVPELADRTIALADEYRLPLLFPREIESYLGVLNLGPVDPAFYAERHAALAARGAAFVDRFVMTPWVASAESDATYRRMIEALEPGVTFFSLHPNAPGDIEVIIPELAHCRTDEHRLGQDPGFLRHVEDSGVVPIGFAPLLERLRAATARA
ncbi:MAG: polysaccharide deacetylase family protein [Geminicoccaceae bacterium]|nr:polysaccharide deacetylase family protein [Geminicoccaceae bacterium]MCB9968374.1 polysaccharide deacetylase family protein [Geminicoccaceae bacterium]